MTTQLVGTKDLLKGGHRASSGFFGFFSSSDKKQLVPVAPVVETPKPESRTIDETIRLLKRAQKTIEKAERIITEQTLRIQNLEDMNTVDELTGFLNPRGFERAFQRERSRLVAEKGRNALIVLIEMENFDFVQNKHGARTSDACLKVMSRVLRDEIREMDTVGRIKKSEFAVLFTGAQADIALERAQKLALKVNSLALPLGRESVPVSASIRLQDFGPNTPFYSLF